ncbi:helix-turn-helix domain-containing protein [Variovorax sp. RO1]|uniref:helix-turn-helix domain-containing protein n=1 Tax=Variovorax sp. RO1 TaxID=2066034 RepID=UPI002151FC0D|nr:helix-turn-helix transcriptional regulator [Variovorax sp. RO1]
MTTASRSATPSAPPPQSGSKSRSTAAARLERETNPVSLQLGKHLKTLRIDRQLSQEELADKSEVDRTLISRIERGVANPSLMTLSIICFVLKITLSELVAPIRTNLKPHWADPAAPIRRAAGQKRTSSTRRLR